MTTMNKARMKSRTTGKHFVKAGLQGQRGSISPYQDYNNSGNRKKKLKRKPVARVRRREFF